MTVDYNAHAGSHNNEVFKSTWRRRQGRFHTFTLWNPFSYHSVFGKHKWHPRVDGQPQNATKALRFPGKHCINEALMYNHIFHKRFHDKVYSVYLSWPLLYFVLLLFSNFSTFLITLMCLTRSSGFLTHELPWCAPPVPWCFYTLSCSLLSTRSSLALCVPSVTGIHLNLN